MTSITTESALRELYAAPGVRAIRKQLDRLDHHCRRFIELSPFLVLASTDGEGRMDASPRGGAPGFVKALDERTLLIPDSKGNNRLDSLANLLRAPGVGLLFLIPGVDETLRVNGTASLGAEAERVAIRVQVRQAYLHCAKSLMRAKLWDPAARRERSVLPTMNQMIKDQIGQEGEPESEAAMRARYRADL
jgi:PPOX class probable FMN-dependent enzyme